MSETITMCYETDVSQFAPIAVPVGSILPFAGTIPPQGYLICDGAELLETEYASLFSVIGSNYGVGQAANSFKVPDLRGRVPIGVGQGDGLTERAVGATGGAEQHQLTVDEMPAHSHDLVTVDGRGSLYDYPVRTDLQASKVNLSGRITPTGGDQPHNNMQPFLVVNYIIKV